jgi:general secretion pathway protein I
VNSLHPSRVIHRMSPPPHILSSRQRAVPSRSGAARGFTLIEVVLAFAILALGLGITMQIATSAMRNARQAAQRTEAALYAKSLLDSVGVGERLEEGDSSGEFSDDFQWTLSAVPYEVESETQLEPGASPVQLYRLELVVSWGSGRNEQEAHFVTLRALTPDQRG